MDQDRNEVLTWYLATLDEALAAARRVDGRLTAAIEATDLLFPASCGPARAAAPADGGVSGMRREAGAGR